MEISIKRIKHIMGAALMTQAQLAEKSGVSRATINNTLLKGACSTQTAGKIARGLGVSVTEIMKGE